MNQDEFSLFNINVPSTKDLLKKYRRQSNAVLGIDDDHHFLSSVISTYYSQLHKQGLFGASENAKLTDRYNVEERLKLWESGSTDIIPTSFEKYILLSSIMGLRYTDLISIESDIIRERWYTRDWASALRPSGEEIEGSGVKSLRLDLPRIRMHPPLDNGKGYEFVRIDDEYDKIKDLTMNKMQKSLLSSSRIISSRNEPLLSILGRKLKLDRITAKHLECIIRDIDIVRNLCRLRTNTPRIEKLCAFEYLFEQPVDDLYGVNNKESDNREIVKVPVGKAYETLTRYADKDQDPRSTIRSLVATAAVLLKYVKNGIYANKTQNGFILYDIQNDGLYSAIPYFAPFGNTDGVIKCTKTNGYGLVNDDIHLLPIYDKIPQQSDDLSFVVCKEGKYFYIDSNNQQLFNKNFDFATKFKNGYATISIDGHEGVINRNGEITTQPTFAEIYEFSNGLAVARKSSDKYGYINPNGEFVIPPIYDQAASFTDNIAMVISNGIITTVTRP